jgi:hypothetical protein
MINGDENGVAWNARLQQLMRAAQTLGPGNAQLIVNTANPFDQDDEGDGPLGLTGVVTAHDADSDSSDSEDDEPGELYVEDDNELMMEETRRDVWKALRTADMGACQPATASICALMIAKRHGAALISYDSPGRVSFYFGFSTTYENDMCIISCAHVCYIAVILTFCAGYSVRKLVIEGWITSEDKIEILADMLEHPEVHTPAFVKIAAADSHGKTEDPMVEKAHRLLCPFDAKGLGLKKTCGCYLFSWRFLFTII